MMRLVRLLLVLPQEASTYAAEVDLLHLAVILTTLGGAAFVFLLAVFFAIRYRRRSPDQTTPNTRTPVPLEMFIIATLLSLFLFFWVVGATQYVHIMTPPEGAIPVYVTGKQWMWKFSYPDGRATMDVLVVPVGRPIKLVMTSRDVIHSFYVPAFRMKHDVVPGRYYAAWFEANAVGSYDIECAEYCGVSHSRMLGQVRVLSSADYGRWLSGGFAQSADLAEAGREVASRRACFSCHTLDGQPHIGPTWAQLYGARVALAGGAVVTADDAYLTRSMMEPEVEVVAGYKPVMPSYRGILDEPEVAALVELIHSLRDASIAPSVALPRVIPAPSGLPEEPRR